MSTRPDRTDDQRPALGLVLRCSCGLPYARIVGRVILIESKHHGQKHTNVINLDELEAKEQPAA